MRSVYWNLGGREAMEKKRILFVDDEAAVLEGLQNLLRRERNRWDLHFALSAEEGMKTLAEGNFDVVVSDVRMPVKDGVAFLGDVKDSHPEVARIVLSGFADRDAVLRSLTVAHQFLAKPCDVQVLRTAIERVCDLQTAISNPAIRALVGGVNELPSVPKVYTELERAANNPNVSVVDLAEIVQRDPALAAKVLQLVNSAYFGVSRRITSIVDAVMYLGAELLKTITLTTSVFSHAPIPNVPGFSIDELQSSSIMCARLAQKFVTDRRRADEAFAAGMLHDIGMVLLVQKHPEKVARVLERAAEEPKSYAAIELEEYGTSHSEVGAYLLGLWGLPFQIVEAVALHHRPSLVGEGGCDVLAALHVADAFSDTLLGIHPGLGFEDRLDRAFVTRCRLEEKLPEWRKIANQMFA